LEEDGTRESTHRSTPPILPPDHLNGTAKVTIGRPLPFEPLACKGGNVGDKQPSTRPGASASAGRPVLTRRSEPVGRAFAVIGLVGPLFYIWLVIVLGLLWSGYDPFRQTQNELGAVDSPY
jgi:hypothetical protein